MRPLYEVSPTFSAYFRTSSYVHTRGSLSAGAFRYRCQIVYRNISLLQRRISALTDNPPRLGGSSKTRGASARGGDNLTAGTGSREPGRDTERGNYATGAYTAGVPAELGASTPAGLGASTPAGLAADACSGIEIYSICRRIS